jgi:hypothetical protein
MVRSAESLAFRTTIFSLPVIVPAAGSSRASME